MNFDHYFSIGTAHQSLGRPCEDYALSGQLGPDVYFGVVADGCSGVSAHTDVGARALAWAFQRSLAQQPMVPFDHTFQQRLKYTFESMQYSPSPADYFATLVGVRASAQAATVLVHGDGAIALRYRDGRKALIELEWQHNMPMYLNYLLSEEALEQFSETHRASGAAPFLQRTTVFTSAEQGVSVMSQTVQEFELLQVLGGHVLTFNPAAEEIMDLVVLSDGYAQVKDTPRLEVANSLLEFKNYNGEYLKRRMIRAFKDMRQGDKLPQDDIGAAALHFPGGPHVN